MNWKQKLNQALLLSKEWFQNAQNDDFGWPRLKSSPSQVTSTSEAINALTMLGEDSSSPQVRKGLLWLLEKRNSWGMRD
ncbi:MAG: hypothetical protein RMI79_03765 [Nitrososphaerota archaeon]|nr:hypothetical protein [Nitrososphaerota archaeon]